ncbi:hypothetical protein QCN27_03790 [Cereibacter sp. SYSU M97828]|nr:hypothetical protein [Cereibacter flavus]
MRRRDLPTFANLRNPRPARSGSWLSLVALAVVVALGGLVLADFIMTTALNAGETRRLADSMRAM